MMSGPCGLLSKIEDRFQAYFEGARSMYVDREATQAYFEMSVLALRDEALRARLAQLNDWIIDEYTRAIEPDAEQVDRIQADLTFAAVEGLSSIGQYQARAAAAMRSLLCVGTSVTPMCQDFGNSVG
jgi:hypothetical protein